MLNVQSESESQIRDFKAFIIKFRNQNFEGLNFILILLHTHLQSHLIPGYPSTLNGDTGDKEKKIKKKRHNNYSIYERYLSKRDSVE